MWNRRIITIPGTIEKPDNLDHVILYDPNLDDRNMYLLICDIEEKRARDSGVSTEAELLQNARFGGYWGSIEEDIEAKAEGHLVFLQSEFEAKKKFRSRQNIIQLQIDDTIAKQTWVKHKRAEFRLFSAEYIAHEIAAFFMLRRLLRNMDNKLILADDDTFLYFKNNYHDFLYFCVQDMMQEGGINTQEIREIARSVEWRLIWTLSRENLSSIFNRPIGDLSLKHRLLIYWSRIYDSALESHEPPDMETINNDERFNDWLAHRDVGANKKTDDSGHKEQGQVVDGHYIENCTCGAKSQNQKRGLGEKLPHDNICLYGTWHQYTAEEKLSASQRIYGRNNANVRKFIDKEQENVSKKGLIEEQHLRGKKSRELLGFDSKVIRKK